MRRFRLVSALAVVSLVIGCGSKSPTAPTGPRPTGLVITGVDAILTGLSTSYTLTATFSDGSPNRTVPAIWSSSNPDVATVDTVGRLEARSHGATNLTASSGGQTVTKVVQGVNNYGGTWEGRFVVNRCEPWAWCAAMETDYFSFPIYLEVSQTGADQSGVTARLILPSFSNMRANVSGRVTSDGRLALAGSSEVSNSGTVWATFQLEAWDTTLSDGGMTGRWQQRLNILQPSSTQYMENQLETMKRSNTAAAVPGR